MNAPDRMAAVDRSPPATRDECVARDRADPLAPLRDEFLLPEGVVYLDGNSLGALPARTPHRLARVIADEWGGGLIGSWNKAGWIDLGRRIGDKVAPLIGAGSGEVSVGDSTSANLFKALSCAVALQKADAPERDVVVSERGNFPTDLYMAESVCASAGLRLLTVDRADLPASVDRRTAVLMLTHVNYRTGRVHDMAETTRLAHAVGALVVWDLAHSAGALPVDLGGADADFAVGCGYKYLNGGPGAPAFVWAHPRHVERMDREQLRQPLSGWLGHAAPFEFAPSYRPAPGIARFVCGTPPVLSMSALECGVDLFVAAQAHGGMAALRAKSIALTSLFIERVEATCAGRGLELVTPRDPAERGSQVSFAHVDGYRVMQALIERGVVGDFRAGMGSASPTSAAAADAADAAEASDAAEMNPAVGTGAAGDAPRPATTARADDARPSAPADLGLHGDLLRFGFTPLYTRFVDAWDAAETLREVLDAGEWRHERFARHAAVT